MVDEGKVMQEDKAGNDEADTVAEKGSHDEQSIWHSLTKLFARRHQAYQKCLARVQHFLVAMRKAETQAWYKKTKVASPFQGGEGRSKPKKETLQLHSNIRKRHRRLHQ